MKRLIALIIIILVITSSCYSENNDTSTNDEKGKLKVGIFLYRYDDHFIYSVKSKMEDLIERNSKEWSDIEFDFFDGKNQNEIQIDQIKEAIESDYDALAINIVERSSATKIIELAKAAEIPIVFFNRQPVDVDMARWDKLYYVGLDGTQSGKMQGDIVIDYWNKHPEMDKNGDGVMQYVLLQGQYNHQDTILRTKYSVETIKNSGIEVEEIAKETGNWQRTQADQIISDLLPIYGEKIELILANNDMMALGAVDAIKRKNKTVDIPIVGVDGTEPAIDALKKKEIIGTIKNDENEQAEAIINIVTMLAKGEDPYSKYSKIENGTYYWVEYKPVVK